MSQKPYDSVKKFSSYPRTHMAVLSEKIMHFVAVDIIPNRIAYEQIISAGMIQALEPSLNPMAVYLSQLSPSSRRTMRGALETIAKIVMGNLMPLASLGQNLDISIPKLFTVN